jgi:Na+-translocating ferredoxin:NAD+ oxidoreductase RnfD subunit
VFNPAALALLGVFHGFDSAQNWWGALPETPAGSLLLLATGVFIANRVDKVPLVLWFLGGYFLLHTATAFLGYPERVAELFRSPDLHAALFFAFFMATDPPTSPPGHRDQAIYAAIVVVGSYAAFHLIGAADFLLAALLAANGWEAARRSRARSRRRGRVQVAAPVR